MKDKITKVKDIVEKNENLIVLGLIILSLIGISLNVYVVNSDELWLFQNTYKLFNGFEMYKDINCIITPLFLVVGNGLFKVLGANFLTFRIYSIIIQTLLFFISYLILKKLNVGKLKSFIIMQILLIFSFSLLSIGANYNILSLVFWLIGIYFNIKPKKHNNIIQAIIWFGIYLTKQNIAILYGISLILFEITKKEEKNKKIKTIIAELLWFGVLVTLSIVVMHKTGCLEGFINYAILGLNEFAIKNIYINWQVLLVVIALLAINTITTILLIKKKICTEKEELILLNIFSIPIFFIAYPIFNEYHILMGSYVMILLLIYNINNLVNKFEFKIKSKYVYASCVLLMIVLLGNSIKHFEQWKNNMESNKNTPYYGGVFKDEEMKSIKKVSEYIDENERKVIVLSGKAAFYNIYLGTSNGMFDLPFKGNFGKKGEQGLIEEIGKLKNTEILIEKNEEDLIYQESLIARKYIKENFKKIGEIEEFEIYFSN